MSNLLVMVLLMQLELVMGRVLEFVLELELQ